MKTRIITIISITFQSLTTLHQCQKSDVLDTHSRYFLLVLIMIITITIRKHMIEF